MLYRSPAAMLMPLLSWLKELRLPTMIFLIILCVFHIHAAPSARMSVNIKDFGAAGDGRADDTAAIQRAIEAGRKEELPVLWPRGRYRVTRPLVIEAQSLAGPEPGGWNADNCPMPQIVVDHTAGPALTMRAWSCATRTFPCASPAQNGSPTAHRPS